MSIGSTGTLHEDEDDGGVVEEKGEGQGAGISTAAKVTDQVDDLGT